MSSLTRDRIRKRRAALGLLVAWIGSAAMTFFAAFQSRFDLSNIDSISYMSIARQYAAGHSEAAVNAYWSPAVSWLMAPQIAAGVPEILSFDLVSAFAATVAIGVAAWFTWRRTNGNLLISLAVMAMLLIFALGNIPVMTPDMLVVAWIVIFIAFLAELDDRHDELSLRGRVGWGVALGVICALGYVIKLYLVPVFIVTLLICLAIRLLMVWRMRAGRSHAATARPLLVTAAVAVLAVLLVSAPWVTALSVKYGEVTAGSSMAVNLENKFESTDGAEPVASTTLYAPPNEYAVSFGEDRTLQVGTSSAPASPLAARIWHYVSERVPAFPWYIERISSIAPFAGLSMVLFGLLLMVRAIDPRRHRAAVLIAITWTVYFLGYAAVTSAERHGGNARYYWPLLVLSLLLAAIMLPSAWSRVRAFKQWPRTLGFIAAVALIPVAVVVQLGMAQMAPFSTLPQLGSMKYIFATPQPTTQETFATQTLGPLIPEHSKIVGSNYRVSLRYAYFLDAQVYGRASQNYDPLDPIFQQVMRDAGIDYFLQFTPANDPPLDLSTIGKELGSFDTRSTCSDMKSAVPEKCTVTVYALAPSGSP